MNRLLWTALVVILAALEVGLGGTPSRASFVSSKCFDSSITDYNVRRKDAQAYALVAQYEGYEWGGGCWNNNNKDDTPGEPDSNGEGPDCSGFVFKTWELVNTLHKSGFTWYDKLMNIHGPYTSYDFHDPTSDDPFKLLSHWESRKDTMYMDAFATDGHMGLLSSDENPGTNEDYIIEAKSDDLGTNIRLEDYRYDSAYVGVTREDWTPDCWPSCQGKPESVVSVP